MRTISPSMARLRAGCLALVAALVLPGCASLSPTPPVDILPTTPPPLAVVPRTPPPVTGSLYQQASYRPAFEDRRARMVGDNVTIQIVENVTASQKSSSSVDRNSEISAGISALPFVNKSLTDKTTLGAKSDNTFAGKGGTESANTFSGSITATVIDVLPNGHLVVAGEKQIGVNQNVDVLRFSGTIDPRALQPGSIINSTQVANVRVESRGRGAQSEAQVMGWLGRFFLTILPF
ncbi:MULTISPECIES: flagellar basal body L-ring protein FlgH [unclassified Simplicispira]|uniref:flagellar basal body L-ring protein FlgH n=1 Tax=unclassified Simplicispira TaxID=2630407 RepID=UPI000D5C8959|nr:MULTISPECIES: flagellar basal body L-ring protein FlgH [unclassified Simplicispira]PVY56993.1 flagellar L-ring protein precursor FlgH [Simplicispira sp. 125]REG17938.1 flagellar L-ring protein precursor FlgH [Simplicispira sp. 110]